MPYNRKNRKPRRVARKPYVKRADKCAPPSKCFKTNVLKVIRSQAETKQAYGVLNTTNFNSGISGLSDILKIVPNVSNGTADNQKIGDQIIAQKITIRGIINMVPQGLGQGDNVRKIAARLMIVTPKSFPNWSTASASTAWQSYLLKKGGTVTGFTGAVDDLFAPHNADAITLHYNRVFFLNQGSYYPTVAGANGAASFEQNNMVRFFKKTFNFKNKLLKYDANVDSGLTPTNLGMVAVLGYVFTDGTSPDTVSTRVSLQYDTIFSYEDA